MREHGRELLDAPDALTAARDRCDYLARACGVDARAIWEWGVMERVSTGLLALRTGRGRLGAEMLAVATALARA
jgi:streptomycin 6-kinase